MNKRMRELQGEILKKSKEAQEVIGKENASADDIKKASDLMDEVDALQKEFETLERVEKSKKAGVPSAIETAKKEQKSEEENEAVKSFANAVRARFKGLNEGTPADGGYTVPEDISTKINTLREEHFSLANLVDHENVTTNAGRRTYKKRAQYTGFTQVGEGAKIGQTATPKFSIIDYAIKKYGGYMPVTNELLEDSDENITKVMTEWLAQEAVATENAQILAKVKEKTAIALSGIKDIKKAINVTLSAFKGSVKIVTNADGINYLDTLEDANKRPLLSPDPVKPMETYLSVGVRRIPVIEIPNHILQTEESKIPFIMGDLFEYLKRFDRKKLTLMTSNTASVTDFNAFEEDMTLIRAIMRDDWVVKDDTAIVFGEITVA